MKYILVILLFTASITAFSNSVSIKIINNSIWTLERTNFRVDHGKLCVTDDPSSDHVIPAAAMGKFYSGPSCGATGNDGFVEYTIRAEGKIYQVYIGFDVPFIGDNSYDPKASHPFVIKHLSGGEGSEVFISYEISGGPSPKPPPPPLILPSKGNRTISGYFVWDTNKTGLPFNNEMVTAFSVRAKAPRLFRMNNDGTGSHQYGTAVGTYEDMQDVGMVFFTLQKPGSISTESSRWQESSIANGQQLVYYKITNLPEGIPIDVKAEPAVSWEPGPAADPKPNKPSAEYIAYCSVKGKGVDNINYQVEAIWTFTNGTGAGMSDNPDARRQILAKKGIHPGMDVFGAGIRRGTLISTSPGTSKTLISPGVNANTNVTNNGNKTTNINSQTLKSKSAVQQKASIQLKSAAKKAGNN